MTLATPTSAYAAPSDILLLVHVPDAREKIGSGTINSLVLF